MASAITTYRVIVFSIVVMTIFLLTTYRISVENVLKSHILHAYFQTGFDSGDNITGLNNASIKTKKPSSFTKNLQSSTRTKEANISKEQLLPTFGQWKSQRTNSQKPAGNDEILITNGTLKFSQSQWFPTTGNGSMDSCYDHYLDRNIMPCRWSTKKEDLAQSDAVLFRVSLLPAPELLPYHPTFQKWIAWSGEAASYEWQRHKMYHRNPSVYNYLFNLSASFTSYADIQTHTPLHICSVDQRKKESLWREDYAKKKRKDVLVAWFASHCPTPSRREDYVAELRRYIKVDIYGTCGNLTCGRSISKEGNPKNKDRCHKSLLHGNNSYKFYLSFENSLCPEYATEKLFYLMALDVVPVVMGGANYSSLLPTNAYIDVKDYKSPKDLAEYLLELNQNDTLYNDYVYNKKILSCQSTKLNNHELLPCRICRRLHELKDEVNIVQDMEKSLGPSRCMTPEKYLSL